jgi:hypothetical protein
MLTVMWGTSLVKGRFRQLSTGLRKKLAKARKAPGSSGFCGGGRNGLGPEGVGLSP